MGALNGHTHLQPTEADVVRARTIIGLFEPVREIVMAADRLHSAIVAKDIERLVAADKALQVRISEYLERMAS